MTQQPPNEAPVHQAEVFDENLPIRSLARLNQAMGKWAPQLAALAPKSRGTFDFDRFKAVVLSCASRTPDIVLCSYYSIRQAVNSAAELGLELGSVAGEAYMIPHKNRKKSTTPEGRQVWIDVLEATFIPGYKGYVRLMQESGFFRDIGADVILPDDTWQPITKGPEKLTWGHIQGEPGDHPAMEVSAIRYDRGERIEYMAPVAPLRGAYAYAKLKDREADDIVRVIWRPRLEEIRLRSKAGLNGPWITDYHEMARKTALRALWKGVPKSQTMLRVEELDREFDFESTQRDGRETQGTGIVEGRALPPGSATPALPPRTAVSVPAAVGTPTPAAAKANRVAERVNQRAAAKNAPPPPPSGPEEASPPPSAPEGQASPPEPAKGPPVGAAKPREPGDDDIDPDEEARLAYEAEMAVYGGGSDGR